ncbi:unnamed protein product, partial [Rotaria sp. Silwood1]
MHTYCTRAAPSEALPVRTVTIPSNAKWLQNGDTVVGGNGQGSQLNQIYYPYSLCVDEDGTIYVSDRDNDRIVEWKCNAKSGQVVAGGNGRGKENNQFNCPTDAILDKKTDTLIICDYRNRRVMRWPRRGGTSGEILISNVSCERLTVDDEGFLYISSPEEHVVRRWRLKDNSVEIVAGGNGKGNRLNQLDWPTFIFVDRKQCLYVSEWNNNRVTMWMKGANEGIAVAGGNESENDSAQLNRPAGLLVDQSGTVYVTDHGNNRVLCWPKGCKKGRVVVGGNGRGNQ